MPAFIVQSASWVGHHRRERDTGFASIWRNNWLLMLLGVVSATLINWIVANFSAILWSVRL
jgi:hypothetical protein